MVIVLNFLELNMVLFNHLEKKKEGGKKSLKDLVTILLIYTIFCIICDLQHHTSNLFSALKSDIEQQFSYDSHHREKHLAQLLKAGYVW